MEIFYLFYMLKNLQKERVSDRRPSFLALNPVCSRALGRYLISYGFTIFILILVMHKGFLALTYEKELLSTWQLWKDRGEAFFCVNWCEI